MISVPVCLAKPSPKDLVNFGKADGNFIQAKFAAKNDGNLIHAILFAETDRNIFLCYIPGSSGHEFVFFSV